MTTTERTAAPALLCGWVDTIDDDRAAFTLRTGGRVIRVVPFEPGLVRGLRAESVVAVAGRGGDDGTFEADELTVLNHATSVPFTPAGRESASGAARARFRYLEFRDPDVAALFARRHHLSRALSGALDRRGFISLETPILAAPSASGAKEFAVTGASSPNAVYALPQSAQVYGQLAVIGGFERYYQWSRCFRDEDLRANRQPEFTQLHVEAAFMDLAAIKGLAEELIVEGCAALGIPVEPGFATVTYETALQRYGTDKPDLRCAVEETLLPHRIAGTADSGEVALVKTRLPVRQGFARDELAALGVSSGFTLVGFVDERDLVHAFLPPAVTLDHARASLRIRDDQGDGAVPVWTGRLKRVDALVRGLYEHVVARRAGLRLRSHAFGWVERFPLFENDPAVPGKISAVNSPFTAPADEAALLAARKNRDLVQLEGLAFDLVLNGEEVATGSVLIHKPEVQRFVLQSLGVSRKDARAEYGAVLDALETGAPPIAGIGFGFDRLFATLEGREKIRDVMAFPKTKQGFCPVMRSQT